MKRDNTIGLDKAIERIVEMIYCFHKEDASHLNEAFKEKLQMRGILEVRQLSNLQWIVTMRLHSNNPNMGGF